MEIIGKPTIHPWLFYPGKISGYIVWVAFVYSIYSGNSIKNIDFLYTDILAYGMLAAGLIFIAVSLLQLGRSVRFGLPVKSTVLKTKGIYRISRNPMYVGFGLFTLASMIYTLNLSIIVLGIFSLYVYHLIIKSEEKFLMNRFGPDYENYCRDVRRYI